jgi:tRNA (guanine-N7-)-methyltransferase
LAKKKLERFAEMDTFEHVFHAHYEIIKDSDFNMKGKWNSFFGNDNPIIVELGCGKGEYTVGLAEKYPENNYIGLDVKGARMWRGAKESLGKGLKNVAFVRTRIDFITKIFAQDEISEIWITFPDPQKDKRRKRLTSPMFLERYKIIAKQNGIVNLKTDSRIMYLYTKSLVETNNYKKLIDTNDLYNTKGISNDLEIRTFYEQMFLDEGKNITYLKFELEQSEVKDAKLTEQEIKELAGGVI